MWYHNNVKNKFTKYGFTLIEIMASLMIFAIGGSIALSFFSFNASSRINIEEKLEAYQLADNIIKSIILKKTTGKSITLGNTKFKYPAGFQYRPNENVILEHDDWFFADIGIQTFGGSDNNIPVAKPLTSSNTSYMVSSSTNESKYEYGYSLVDNPSNALKYIRHEDSYTEPSSPSNEVSLDDSLDMFTVVVTWPKSDPNRYERKRVLLSVLWEE